VGLDPLTLWGEILTVAVFDDEVVDELFSGWWSRATRAWW
jgi:hypothetical protein